MEPTEGWGEDGLATLFTIRTVTSDPGQPASATTSSVSAPTTSTASIDSPEPVKGISIGAIVGIVVGAVVLIGAIVGGIFFFLKSRRTRRISQHDMALLEKDGLPSYSTAASLGTAELVGTPQAAELSAKQQGHDTHITQQPVEKDAGTRDTRTRQVAPIEME